MDSTESYVQKMEAQLKEWSAVLDRMKARADKASADTKLKMQRQIEELKAREIAARAKLQQIRSAGQQALNDARGTIDKAWADLKGAFERARADLKD